MMRKPKIAITMGDAAGIGPEIVVKCLADPRLREWCDPVVLGDLEVLRGAAADARTRLLWQAVDGPQAASADTAMSPVIDYANVDRTALRVGEVAPPLGAA